MNKTFKLLTQNSLVFFFLFLASFNTTLGFDAVKIHPFRISNLEGERFNSREMLGKPIVISFFFTRCPPCRKEMPELFNFMKENGQIDQLLFVDSFVKAEGIGVEDDPDTEMMISSFIEKLKIDPANVYFDQLGSLLKKFLRVNAFPKAKKAGTKVIWPTILVISSRGELVESMEGSHPDFLEKLKKYL